MRCTAKAKSTGEQCRRSAKRGYNVCRVHGANASNPGGAPKGSTNALKHGAYQTLLRERLPEEERAAFDAVSVDPSLVDELRVLRYKYARLLGQVSQNVHGKDKSWQVKADDFEKARALAIIAAEIRKIVKEMRDLGEADPLVEDVVRDWEEGMIADGVLDAESPGSRELLSQAE